MKNFLLRIGTKALFHSDGVERYMTKRLLNAIDNVPMLHRLAATCLFPKTGNLRLFFAPRYAKKRYSPCNRPISVSENLPKVTVITMVRNEHARIHDFMRHVCALFDRVIVIDHHSDDDTGKIASDYHGINNTEVIVMRGEDDGHYQSEYMTACANALIREYATDWIFFLDVDEFLTFHNRLAFQQALVSYNEFPFIHMPWRNIALKQLDPTTVQGTYGIIGPQSHLSKIAINVRMIKNTKIIINEGNHTVRLQSIKTIIPSIQSFDLYHIPIIGKKALKNKVEQGIKSYQLSVGKRKSMGFHWKEMLNDIEKIMSDDILLQGISIGYSTPLKSIITRIKDGTIMNGCKDIVIDIAQSEKSRFRTH